MRRLTTVTYLLKAMDALPENKDGETAKWISKELKISRGTNRWVGNVISEARECAKAGVQYSGKRTQTTRPTLYTIPLNLPAARIVAESMVDGNGIRQLHADVMGWLRRRHNKGKPNVQ